MNRTNRWISEDDPLDEPLLEEPLLDGADEVAQLEGRTVPLLPGDRAGRGRWPPDEPALDVPPEDPDEPGDPDPLVVDPDEVLGLPLPEGADEPGSERVPEDDGLPLEDPEEPDEPDPLDDPEEPDDEDPLELPEDDPLDDPLLERPDEDTDPAATRRGRRR